MADRSAIEWTDASWNPIRARNRKTGKVGWHCEHATTGCVNCYSEGFNLRLGTGLPFKPGHRDDIELFLDNEMVLQPLRWKKPRKIFVCSMTDLFADFVPDVWIDTMFGVMALAPQHTFQVLTKRAKRMREYLTGTDAEGRTARQRIDSLVFDWRICGARPEIHGSARLDVVNDGYDACERWPLPNICLGVSAERQSEADERIPELLAAPATVRFISAEPLLGPIDLKQWMPSGRWGSFNGEPVYHQTYFMTRCERCSWFGSSELCYLSHNADDADVVCPGCNEIFLCDEVAAKLHWVIVGGESGQKARSMHPAWPRSLRDQCAASGTAFFFKQWGEWAPSTEEKAGFNPHSGWQANFAYPHVAKAEELYPEKGAAFVARVGKRAAGRLLDGIEHNDFPAVKDL